MTMAPCARQRESERKKRETETKTSGSTATVEKKIESNDYARQMGASVYAMRVYYLGENDVLRASHAPNAHDRIAACFILFDSKAQKELNATTAITD